MHTFKTMSVLALAATTAFAAPAASPAEANALEAREPGYGGYGGGGNWRGGNRWWYRPQPDATVTVTGYGDDSSAPTDTPAQPEVTSAPDTSSNFGGNYGGNRGGWSSAPAAPASPPASPPAGGSTPSVGGGGDWLSIANKWAAATGRTPYIEDATLVANAQNTADSSGGQLVHKLNPGSFAQVLAPGDASNFESVFLGGWLCELPNTPGLNGVCGSASQGWNHGGQTGHADILLDNKYSKIGCALGNGIWSCDLS